MKIPSPASVIPPTNTGGNLSNYDWYKQRGANLPDITTQGVGQQAPVMLGGQHTVMDDTFIEGMPSAGTVLRDSPEDAVIPPSLEEMGVNVEKPKEYVSLDEYIKSTTEQVEADMAKPAPHVEPVVKGQTKELGAETTRLLKDDLYKMTIKELRDYYRTLGGSKDTSKANNKNYLVSLILRLKTNGTQSEEEQE